MKLNPSVTYFFSVFPLILLLFAGCGEDEMTGPKTAPKTATVEIKFTLPGPPAPPESVEGPFCEIGDILQPGDSCFYPGTDIKISILEDGMLKMGYLSLNTRQIHLENTSLNGTAITLIAQRRNDNSWKIEKIGDAGDAGKLDVIISTDFIENPEPKYPNFNPANGIDSYLEDLDNYSSYQPITYNTQHEFALTQNFSQDFPLDPNDPRVAVIITNNTSHDLSVHFTVLLDGEVETDERESFTSGSRYLWSWRWITWSWTLSTTNE
ncbi:MAG: hypothetical protein OXN27_05585 [Candidatus Poribacteria bacterium]|nr:hypothetical protein [Candidatus Poribacteria bacterium]